MTTDGLEQRQHGLDVQFPPVQQPLNRTADLDGLRQLMESSAWLPDPDAVRAASKLFQRFTSGVERILQPALNGRHLPWEPLPQGGPRILPILHEVAPNLRGWIPDNGNLHVGLHCEGRFVEFGYIFDDEAGESRWKQTSLQTLFVPPQAVLQAIVSGLRKACDRATKLNENAAQVKEECLRATQLLDHIRRQE